MLDRLSIRNPRVAEIRGLSRQRSARAEAGSYVVDGIKNVREALDAEVAVRGVFVETAALFDARVEECVTLAQSRGIDVWEVEEATLVRVTSTKSSQGIAAVADGRPGGLEDLPAGADFVLVGVDINDPGNAGTMMRSAVAAGADAVVLAGDCVDPTNPKTIRASAGAFFKVPIIVHDDVPAALAAIQAHGLRLLGAAGEATSGCHEVDLSEPVAIVLGSEAHGLSEAARAALDIEVRIPMPGPVESLNVAMAGAILAYEVTRQRSA